jgi:hypothetical protein
MDKNLRNFVVQFVGVVLATLIPVIIIAFLSMPWQLNRHPGESAVSTEQAITHLT